MSIKFFIPVTKDAKEAEAIWEATKRFAEDMLGWEVSDRRIFSIAYRHERQDYYVEVGKPDPRVKEVVIAILESKTYLVCTPNRGVVRSIPLLVNQGKVGEVIDFQAEAVPDS